MQRVAADQRFRTHAEAAAGIGGWRLLIPHFTAGQEIPGAGDVQDVDVVREDAEPERGGL